MFLSVLFTHRFKLLKKHSSSKGLVRDNNKSITNPFLKLHNILNIHKSLCNISARLKNMKFRNACALLYPSKKHGILSTF